MIRLIPVQYLVQYMEVDATAKSPQLVRLSRGTVDDAISFDMQVD